MTYAMGDRIIEIKTLGQLRDCVYHKHNKLPGFKAKWLRWGCWLP